MSPQNQPLFSVLISEKGGAERRETFTSGELKVGRVQGNELMLPKGNVSKHHARIVFRDGRFIVTDLNSTNGTYVNRRRISQATIVRSGDRIYVGDFVLQVQPSEGEAESVQQAAPPVPPARAALATDGDFGAGGRPESTDDWRPPPAPNLPDVRRTPAESDPGVSSTGRVQVRGELSRPGGGLRGVDPETEAHERSAAVQALVERVFAVFGADLLGAAITPTVRSQVESELRASVNQLKEGGLPVGLTAEMAYEHAEQELVGLGPIQAFRGDPEAYEMAASRFNRIHVRRRGGATLVEVPFSSDASLRRAIVRLCHEAGRPLLSGETLRGSEVERRLPDGLRLSGLFGEDGTLLLLRKPVLGQASLEDLVRQGAISRAIATFLQACVAARANILLAGDGAPTLLKALESASTAGFVSTQDPSSASTLPSRGVHLDLSNMDLAPAVTAMRIGGRAGSLVIVDMVDALHRTAVIDAIGDGAEGVLASYPSPSLRRAFARLPADIAASRPGVSIEIAREWVAGSFDLAIEVVTMRDGRLRAVRVTEPRTTGQGELLLDDIFTFSVERTATGGSIEGTFAASGIVPRFAETIASRGGMTESGLFTRPPSR